jgi:hypothetical protein
MEKMCNISAAVLGGMESATSVEFCERLRFSFKNKHPIKQNIMFVYSRAEVLQPLD